MEHRKFMDTSSSSHRKREAKDLVMPIRKRPGRRPAATKSMPHGPAKAAPMGTRERIMKAAVAEFCDHGYNGARISRIVRAAKSNPRMLYHHFGSKSRLYVAVLDQMYGELRALERSLKLADVPPVEGMRRLMDFTFDHFGSHPGLIRLMNSENLMRARFLRKSRRIRAMTSPLVVAIEDLLRRGKQDGSFRTGVDPVQLYVSVTALSYFHVSNRHTLSGMFGIDLGNSTWINVRREHAREMLLAYLRPSQVTRMAKRPFNAAPLNGSRRGAA